MNRPRTSLVGLVALMAAPAAAQDDWDLGRDPGRKLTIAAVTYENFGVAVRCMDGVMSVVVSGLPPHQGARTIKHQIGDQPEMSGNWISARDSTTAFSIWPAATAAYLSGGGRWTLDIPDGDRSLRMAADLPASPTAIGEVFNACGRTLTPTSRDDEPDQENFGGLRWVRMPTPNFPTRTGATAGLAALTCNVNAGGRLRNCRIESEFPDGAGFGRAAAMSAHRDARVGFADPQPTHAMEGRQVSWVVRYRMSDDFVLQ